MVRGNGVRLGTRGKGVKHRIKRGGLHLLIPLALIAGLATIGQILKKKTEGERVRLGTRGKSIHHILHGLRI